MEEISQYLFIEKLKALPYIESLYLYGSRAKASNDARADIDLAILCPRANDKEWQYILEIIEAADTLLKIDCVRLDEMSDTNQLKKNILREGKII